MLQEQKIIQKMKDFFPKFIGDDAAVMPALGDENLLVSKDLLVEDVHFRCQYTDMASLAHKALHVNMSDIAAMGGKPCYVMLGLSIPLNYDNKIDEFLSAFNENCQQHDIQILGGDTTASQHGLFVSVTVFGRIKKERIKYRHTAKNGDILCVSGNLGWAALGLYVLENNISGYQTFKDALLRPDALMSEGYWLGGRQEVTSMMDCSDGLYLDVQKLAESSLLGVKIDLEKLPCLPIFKKACEHLDLNPLDIMITGGEDYGLIYTVSEKDFERFSKAMESSLGKKPLVIGEINKESSLSLYYLGKPYEPGLKPFSHFGE